MSMQRTLWPTDPPAPPPPPANRAPTSRAEICRTMDRIEEAVKEITDEFAIGTIVLDYAQLITAPGKSLYEQVTETSSRFAAIVRKHRMIGVLLAQYSKEGANARDILAFKGSTQLPQDADVILKIEWPAKENPGHPRPRQFNVGIAKNRNRAVVHREIELEFRPEIQTITTPPPPPCRQGCWRIRNSDRSTSKESQDLRAGLR